MTTPGTLSIGEIAARTGLSVHTLRLYEREGLFTGDVGRTASGQRAYTQSDLDWLGTCCKFRASGMPLMTIRRFAVLVREGPGNEPERLELLREHERLIRGHMADLEGCLALISAKVSSYEEHLAAGTATDLWSPTTRTADGATRPGR